ncbi:ABC transporter permease [Cohnella lupini]|nr:ABC transporter permease [Cohnella lupini]
MNESSLSYLKRIAGIISILSVGVSFILGGLIVYANHFLIKKRKKELGIYMTLGMRRNKISTILVIETFIIGCISLGIGLVLGIVISQGSSELIARLFNGNMEHYQFIVSYSALGKTCLYFGIIYLFVILFNHLIISQVKLIDLLNAAKKNESLKAMNAFVSIIVFLLSAGLLTVTYKMVIRVGFDPYEPVFIFSLLLGVFGTLLLFFSLAGFILFMFQRSRKFYFNQLNIFVLRQLNNKINTNFISMTVISLMLFVTLLSLFVVFNYKANVERTAKGVAPFAASVQTTTWENLDVIPDLKDALEQSNVRFEDSEKHVFFNIYTVEGANKEILGSYLTESSKTDQSLLLQGIYVVGISDYNKIRALKKRDPIRLSDNETLIVSNYGEVSNNFNRFMNNEKSITVKEKTFFIKNKEAITENLLNTPQVTSYCYFIVPDRFEEGLTLLSRALDIEPQGGNAKQFEAKYSDVFDRSFQAYSTIYGFTAGQSRMLIYGVSTFLTFLGLYIGLVFLIASAVVLALQQLVEASESAERYRILKKIGATDKMINRTIFKQTFIYFFLPFAVAVIHTIAGVKVMNDFLEIYDGSALSSSATTLAILFIVIYGGYFYTTYSGYKNIVKNS